MSLAVNLTSSANGNIFIGSQAGETNTTGINNIFIGDLVGSESTAGTSNLYMGYQAGRRRAGGSTNTILGSQANVLGGSGDNNTIIGGEAGFNASGDRNVFLGYQAGYNENGSDKLYIANSDTDKPLIYGDFASGSKHIIIDGNLSDNPSELKFFVNGSAGGTGAWNAASDGRLKTNVRPLEGALNKVLQLNGVTFNWKDENNHRPGENIGFIAQDLQKVLPQIVSGGGTDNQGNELYYSVEYATLTPVLVEAIKEQQKVIESQNEKIEMLEKMNTEILKRLEKLELK